MAGIYIHVPFCRQACSYCDFYFSVAYTKADEYLQALLKEITIRSQELKDEIIETVYFGGGTPSTLTIAQLNRILEQIYAQYTVSTTAEITLEANPDDLTQNCLERLLSIGINRLSIGIQSFFEDELTLMNRRHTSMEAIESLARVKQMGFTNFSADLIYAFPHQNKDRLKENLHQMTAAGVPHISIYQLTYEPGTPLFYSLQKKRIKAFADEAIVEQYELIIDFLTDAGYDQYEISNFAFPGYESRHNASYWKGVHYLGFGPSAHSYDGITRRWNLASIKKYIRGVLNNTTYSDFEELAPKEKYNDYIVTALRTKWGVNKKTIYTEFGDDIAIYFEKELNPLLAKNLITEQQGIYTLTRQGKILADTVCRNLIFI